MMLRSFLLWCVFAVSSVAAPSAFATTTCTATPQNIVVSSYDGSAQQSASGNVSVKCSTDVNSIFGGTAYVALCLYIGNTPRTLVNGSSTLNYHLYTASGADWQGPPTPPASQIVTFNYPVGGWLSSGGSGTINVLVTATIPVQTGLSAGTYSQSITATTGEFQSSEPTGFGGNSTNVTSCKSGGNHNGVLSPNTFPFSVSTTVTPSCQIKTATDLGFGSVPGFITANVDQTSLITLNCVNATAWTMGLNNGVNASGNTRRMSDGAGNFVTYELYRDSGRSQRWGNTINTDTVAGTGTGNDQGQTVYGRVPTQTATPGDYNDRVTVTVTY